MTHDTPPVVVLAFLSPSHHYNSRVVYTSRTWDRTLSRNRERPDPPTYSTCTVIVFSGKKGTEIIYIWYTKSFSDFSATLSK
mmetsp:Transcript_25289/g.28294  ORF Transcript_25289/g.28294 Transcript_25289/m.28294 type:complete len:82 (-) Transcript_25289:316-561(-)